MGGAALVAVIAVIGVAAWALWGGDDAVSTASGTTVADATGQTASDAPCPPAGGTDERITLSLIHI